MFKECTDKFSSIVAAKGMATPILAEDTSVPAPSISPEAQLAKETAAYLTALEPAKRPDSELDEDAEGGDE